MLLHKKFHGGLFHKWKLIPLKLIKNISNHVRHFPCFYKNILLNWKQCLSKDHETIRDILLQNLWFNNHVIIDNSIGDFSKFSHTKINFVDQLVTEFCQCKKWKTCKDKYHLDNDMHLQWAQLIHAIPQTW